MSSPQSQPPKRPLLSFVMTGRNDGFMGDFNWRLGTSINIMARAAARLGRLEDLEVVVVDWNSDISLHEVVELVPEAKSITKFVVVPGKVAILVQKDTVFPHSVVINAGIRRAKGEFISQTGSDVVFTTSSLLALFNALEGKFGDVEVKKAFLTGGRRHIPYGLVSRKLPLIEFENYLDRNAAVFPEERGGAGHAAPTNFMMMHRDLWDITRGFDEEMIYWGFNDIDLALRVTSYYHYVQLENFGVNSLHMEHYPKPRDYTPGKTYQKLNPVNDLLPSLTKNGQDWGLNNYEDIQEFTSSAEFNDINKYDFDLSSWTSILNDLGNQVSTPNYVNLVRDHLNQFAHLPIDNQESSALLVISWFANMRKPRACLEIGFRYPHIASLISRISPGCEILGLIDWTHKEIDEKLLFGRDDNSLVFYVTNCLRHNNHWSFTQFIRLPILTPFNFNLLHDKLPFDLIILRTSYELPLQHLSEFISVLRIGGLMVILSSSASDYLIVKEQVKILSDKFVLVDLADGKNGLLFKMD